MGKVNFMMGRFFPQGAKLSLALWRRLQERGQADRGHYIPMSKLDIKSPNQNATTI